MANNLNAVASSGTNGQFLGNVTGVPTWSANPNLASSCSFMADQLGDQVSVTGDGTIYTATYTNVISNVGGAFDGTSTFTAPNTGTYMFGAAFWIDSTSNFALMTNALVFLQTTGGNYRYWQQNASVSTVNSVTNNFIFYFSTLAPMTAGDTAVMIVRFIGGAKDVSLRGQTATGIKVPYFYGYQVA